jgi:hypothetical protein
MMFDTPDGRNAWFARHEGGEHVEIGSAMHHARSANLAVWGDRQALRDDVARILAIECNQFIRDTGMPLKPVDADSVNRSLCFHAAWESIRRPREERVDRVARSLGRGGPVDLDRIPDGGEWIHEIEKIVLGEIMASRAMGGF